MLGNSAVRISRCVDPRDEGGPTPYADQSIGAVGCELVGGTHPRAPTGGYFLPHRYVSIAIIAIGKRAPPPNCAKKTWFSPLIPCLHSRSGLVFKGAEFTGEAALRVNGLRNRLSMGHFRALAFFFIRFLHFSSRFTT